MFAWGHRVLTRWERRTSFQNTYERQARALNWPSIRSVVNLHAALRPGRLSDAAHVPQPEKHPRRPTAGSDHGRWIRISRWRLLRMGQGLPRPLVILAGSKGQGYTLMICLSRS